MTFLEAINTGYRFRLPKGRGRSRKFLGVSWPDDWYWQYDKLNNSIKVLGLEREICLNDMLFEISVNDTYANYLNYKDWYLHPDDMEKYLFDLKMKRLAQE